MVNLKSKKQIFALMLVLVLALAMCWTLPTLSASAEDATSYYNDNKDGNVTLLDSDGNNFFLKLKDDASLSDGQKLAVMKEIVATADAFQSLKASYVKKDYYLNDWGDETKGLQKIFSKLQYDLKLTEDNYKTYTKAAVQHLLDAAEENANAIKTIAEIFEDYRAEKKQALQSEYVKLFAVNVANENNASADQFNTIGFYDEQAKVELGAELSDGLDAIDGVTFNKDTVSELKTQLDEIVDDCIKKMRAVPRNDLDRVYNLYQDYSAIKDGAASGDEQQALADAKAAAEALYESNGFWTKASQDVKTDSSAKEAAVRSLLKEEIQSGVVSSNNISSVSDKEGIIKVKAFFEDGSEAKILPYNATLKVYSKIMSAAERNMTTALKEKGMGLGYGFTFGIYKNSDYINLERIRENNAQDFYFEVEIDLERYFTNYVKNNKGLLGDLLGDFIGGVWGVENNNEDVQKMSDEIGGKNADGKSICYYYEDGAITPLEYTLNGGILMFETTNFGSFAVGKIDTSSWLESPIFWVIAAVLAILLIIIIVAIIKRRKFKIAFRSNGGSVVTSVRVRKGESIVMPANPTRKGYVFAGWYEDKALTRRFVKTCLTKRRGMKVYAKWNLELTPERVRSYYLRLREALASHASLSDGASLAEGTSKTYAILVAEEKTLKLFVDLDAKKLSSDGFKLQAVKKDKDIAGSLPSVFTITTREEFLSAMSLVDKLVAAFNLGLASDVAPAQDNEVSYTLSISAPVKEEVVEEAIEEAVEAPAEEVVEEAPAEPASEEQLIEYFTKIRARASGYALFAANDKAEDGKILVKLYKKDDEIKCYLALDAETYGLETASLGFGDTPAMISVDNDEAFNKALELVDIVMLEHGLEKIDDEVEERPYDGKNFGFRIHYTEE